MNIDDFLESLDKYATDEWDLSNQILYEMCQKYPSNIERQAVLAKTLIIGRVYAVALERRKKNREQSGLMEEALINDDFYTTSVVSVFEDLALDAKIDKIGQWVGLGILDLHEGQIQTILQLHKQLSVAFLGITGLNKRSFASKYLHFHLPSSYFIYDSRAVEALNIFFKAFPDAKSPRSWPKTDLCDTDYSSFYIRCMAVLRYLRQLKPTLHISPRHLDNLLIAIANQKLRKTVV
ncbi:hypothetical protein [Sphingobacterium sp. LRF_L2]|uniref:hypothetical protein n=1 Tax=Sphingobacterium sp. LRF_L2 TaxID=3369421 RepID=UPI003F6101C2